MAGTIILIVQGYGALGAAVAAAFILWGIGRIDANARGAWAFRPLLVPGVVLLWPLVLWRWFVQSRGADAGRRHRPPRRTQDVIALALAVAIPVILITALLARQDGPLERPAVQIAPPPAAGDSP